MIGDVKRGDIGSTSAAYAVGHLGKVTGRKQEILLHLMKILQLSIRILDLMASSRLLMYARKRKKGIFVLVKTSNPSSGEFQDRLIDGRPLYELVGEKVAQWGDDAYGRRIQLCWLLL